MAAYAYRVWVSEFTLINNLTGHVIEACDKSISSGPLLSPCFLKFVSSAAIFPFLLFLLLPLLIFSSLPPSPSSLSSIFCNTQSFRPSCSAHLTLLFWDWNTHAYLNGCLLEILRCTAIKTKEMRNPGGQSSSHDSRIQKHFSSCEITSAAAACYLQRAPPVSSRLNETIEQMALCDLDLNS